MEQDKEPVQVTIAHCHVDLPTAEEALTFVREELRRRIEFNIFSPFEENPDSNEKYRKDATVEAVLSNIKNEGALVLCSHTVVRWIMNKQHDEYMQHRKRIGTVCDKPEPMHIAGPLVGLIMQNQI